MKTILSLEDKIELVRKDIQTRFPDCSNTIRILLWDDSTDLVECRYGDGKMIHNSIYYNSELTFESYEQNGEVTMIDEFGTETLKYLVNTNPVVSVAELFTHDLIQQIRESKSDAQARKLILNKIRNKMKLHTEELLELEDYFKHLEETVGLKPETVNDVMQAISKLKDENKRETLDYKYSLVMKIEGYKSLRVVCKGDRQTIGLIDIVISELENELNKICNK